MEPRIRYTTTSDGVRIAYTSFGEGPPLVVPPILVASHLQLEWEVAGRRTALERMAQRATVVRYDPRGMGMSQRDAIDFSPDAAARDLQAVADAAGLDRFALYIAGYSTVLPSLADHGDRLSHVVLMLRIRTDFPEFAERLQRIDAFMEEDWALYTEIYARIIVGWENADAGRFTPLLRASHSASSLREVNQLLVTPRRAVEQVRTNAPMMILHKMGDAASARMAAETAAGNPAAHVLGMPGVTLGPYPNELGIAAIHHFIAEEVTAASGPHLLSGAQMAAAVKTIVFTDLVDHTQMMQRLGDARGRDVLREHERITRDLLKRHGGTEVKTIGDAFMASFSSAQTAIECSVNLQRAFASQDAAGERLQVRAGINAGEPIVEQDDLFGSCVTLAARAAARAGAGQILVTDVVRQLAAGKNFGFVDAGEFVPKGFDEAVRLYEVRWRD